MDENEMIEDKEQMARIIAFDLCSKKYHKEWYGEGARCYTDNNYAECTKIKEVVDKLYNANYRKVADDEIVIKKRKYEQLKKYNRDRKRLRLKWQQAKQALEQERKSCRLIADDEIVESMKTYERARQETAKEIFQELKKEGIMYSHIVFNEYLEISLEKLKEIANKYGIELE